MKRPRTHVSDHAIIRYLERVQGFDILRLKAEIGHRVDEAAQAGASAVIIDGFSYQITTDESGRPVVGTILPQRPESHCLTERERKRRLKARGRRVTE